jgi:hypothetical protein
MQNTGTKVMVALQTKDGLAFGYVDELSNDEVTFEVNSNISPGEEMSFRMELKGYEETVMGRIRVTGGRPSRTAAWPVYFGKILEIPPDDKQLLAVWMDDQRDGGSSRRVERNPDDYVKDMFDQKMSGASSASTKLVIDRMNERRARRARLFKKADDVFKKQMELDPGAALGEVTDEPNEQSRESIRKGISQPTEPPPPITGDDGMDLFDLDDLD